MNLRKHTRLTVCSSLGWNEVSLSNLNTSALNFGFAWCWLNTGYAVSQKCIKSFGHTVSNGNTIQFTSPSSQTRHVQKYKSCKSLKHNSHLSNRNHFSPLLSKESLHGLGNSKQSLFGVHHRIMPLCGISPEHSLCGTIFSKTDITPVSSVHHYMGRKHHCQPAQRAWSTHLNVIRLSILARVKLDTTYRPLLSTVH